MPLPHGIHAQKHDSLVLISILWIIYLLKPFFPKHFTNPVTFQLSQQLAASFQMLTFRFPPFSLNN